MTELLQDTADRAMRYLRLLERRGVEPAPVEIAALAALDLPLPSASITPQAVVQELDDIAGPATVASAGGRYFGYVTGGALPVTLAAHWLASVWDQNTAYAVAAPATAALERIALRWLIELFDLGASWGGGFVTGATMGNVCALAAARHAVLARVGWNVEADGLFGAPAINVIVGAEAHSSVFKALGLLGLGRARVVTVPADRQGRLRVDALPEIGELHGPTILCAQAGNVNTGAFDPLPALADYAERTGAWLHVDGAFGLWARAGAATRALCAGAERADSWATDCHKWLNVPYDCGVVLVRDADALRAAMAVVADYLPPAEPGRYDPSAHTPELSRRARGVDVWAALRQLGRAGVDDLVTRCCRHARHFADGLRAAGHAVLNDVELNQVLVSFGDAAQTRRVIAAVQADGTCWCGATVFQGQTAMRISVSSWATTDDDVRQSLAAMLRLTGRSQGNVAAPLSLIPAGDSRRTAASLGRS